jgi:PTS system nitrogen regulatory IIA component
MEFDALDGRPCDVIALLASPADKTGPHIQALAGISRFWNTEEFRAAMKKAQTADDLYAVIQRYQG